MSGERAILLLSRRAARIRARGRESLAREESDARGKTPRALGAAPRE